MEITPEEWNGLNIELTRLQGRVRELEAENESLRLAGERFLEYIQALPISEEAKKGFSLRLKRSLDDLIMALGPYYLASPKSQWNYDETFRLIRISIERIVAIMSGRRVIKVKK